MRPNLDPIDAVLSDDPAGEDLLDVAATVHHLRAAYLPTEPLSRSPELAAFADPHLAVGDVGVEAGPHRGKRNKMLSGVSAFVGTVTGKVVLGTAVAAASVGSLHAADVVDVPALPDRDRSEAVQIVDSGRPDGQSDAETAAEGGGEGQESAEENRTAAEAYTSAVQDWTDCVAGAASAQGDAETRTTAGFDPRESCGEHPAPADFGLGEVPDQAADAAEDATAGRGRGTPGSEPDDRASGHPTGRSDRPADPPDDAAAGRSASETPDSEAPAADQAADPPAADPEAATNSGRP